MFFSSNRNCQLVVSSNRNCQLSISRDHFEGSMLYFVTMTFVTRITNWTSTANYRRNCTATDTPFRLFRSTTVSAGEAPGEKKLLVPNSRSSVDFLFVQPLAQLISSTKRLTEVNFVTRVLPRESNYPPLSRRGVKKRRRAIYDRSITTTSGCQLPD